MARPKGEPNKLTAEVKDKLHLVMPNRYRLSDS